MFAFVLALTLPILQVQAPTRELSTRWHPTVAIETGLTDLAFATICPARADSGGHLFAIDSAGNIAELAFIDRNWQVLGKTIVGERVVAGCAAAMKSDEVWSLVIGTQSGKIIELRRGEMGWGRYEIATAKTPLRAVRATEPGRPGPSQIFVIDGDGAVSNWYVGGSGRWNLKPLPATDGGATHVCFEYGRTGLCAITAGPKGIIGRFFQDTLGNWAGGAWDTLSSGCLELTSSADPSMKDISVYYAGKDGHLRYLFSGRTDDVISRIATAEGAYQLIGKGDQRRFNEFFAMSGSEFCLFEFDTGMLEWVKVPIRSIPAKVVSTVFGPARGRTWHTIYVATIDGKIYEFERDGLENE